MLSNLDASQAAANQEVNSSECPIDGMYLIHKALRVEAGRVEEMARTLKKGTASNQSSARLTSGLRRWLSTRSRKMPI